jgi:thioredoxin reductase
MQNNVSSEVLHDVVIAGGGPGGLAAALTLGRARKRVVLCDAGARRNAAAAHIHNFVTRDGTPPDEFRRIGRQQLATYPSVHVKDTGIESVSGSRGGFQVVTGAGTVEARRLLLCTGMIDEQLPLEGFGELWGSAIFQCPYCHGWEVQDRPWGYLASAGDEQKLLPFSLMARGWTSSLVVFTGGAVDVSPASRATLEAAGIRLETSRIARLVAMQQQLQAVELSDGRAVPCEVLFTHPPQRQVPLVQSLGVALDDHGFVTVDPMSCETSVPGVYAAGDLTTMMQGAVLAAADAARAAAMINLDLAMDFETSQTR